MGQLSCYEGRKATAIQDLLAACKEWHRRHRHDGPASPMLQELLAACDEAEAAGLFGLPRGNQRVP